MKTMDLIDVDLSKQRQIKWLFFFKMSPFFFGYIFNFFIVNIGCLFDFWDKQIQVD
jgi:hypothetical protein